MNYEPGTEIFFGTYFDQDGHCDEWEQDILVDDGWGGVKAKYHGDIYSRSHIRTREEKSKGNCSSPWYWNENWEDSYKRRTS